MESGPRPTIVHVSVRDRLQGRAAGNARLGKCSLPLRWHVVIPSVSSWTPMASSVSDSKYKHALVRSIHRKPDNRHSAL